MEQYEIVKTTDGLRIKWPLIAVQATPRLEMALQEFIEDGRLFSTVGDETSLRNNEYGWRHHPQYRIDWMRLPDGLPKGGVWWLPVGLLRELAERMEESEWEDVTFAVESKQKELAESGIDCD